MSTLGMFISLCINSPVVDTEKTIKFPFVSESVHLRLHLSLSSPLRLSSQPPSPSLSRSRCLCRCPAPAVFVIVYRALAIVSAPRCLQPLSSLAATPLSSARSAATHLPRAPLPLLSPLSRTTAQPGQPNTFGHYLPQSHTLVV